MKKLLALFLLFSLAGCERQALNDPDIVKRDGLTFLAHSTEPLTADVMEWHENGQPYTQFTVIEGKVEGLWRRWHENGQLKEEVNVVNDKREGLYRRWHENGQLDSEVNMVNDKAEGLYRRWHENGQLKEERTYANGKRVD